MPTAHEYRQVVSLLRAKLTEAAQWWNEHGTAYDNVLLEGPFRIPIDERHALGWQALQRLLDEIGEQIKVAEYRAGVCDQYTAEYRAYQNSGDPAATPPPPPAPWAEIG